MNNTCKGCPVLIEFDGCYKCNSWCSVRGPLVLQVSRTGTVYRLDACVRNHWRERAEENERRKQSE